MKLNHLNPKGSRICKYCGTMVRVLPGVKHQCKGVLRKEHLLSFEKVLTTGDHPKIDEVLKKEPESNNSLSVRDVSEIWKQESEYYFIKIRMMIQVSQINRKLLAAYLNITESDLTEGCDGERKFSLYELTMIADLFGIHEISFYYRMEPIPPHVDGLFKNFNATVDDMKAIASFFRLAKIYPMLCRKYEELNK